VNHLTFSAAINAADSESRTLSGQIVPWQKVGNTSAGLVAFEVGSIPNLDPSSVVLLKEHDDRTPVGRAMSFEVTPAGINAKFKVSNTTTGSDILIEAAEGLREGFSVGVDVLAHTYKGEVMHITSAILREVSVVTRPAFGLENASVSEVAASESADEASNIEKEEAPIMGEIETPLEAAEAVEVEAAAPINTPPIFTSPRFEPLTSGQYLEHKVKAAMGDREAAVRVMAADDSTSNNTGLTLPQHLNQFVTNTFGTRPAVQACGGAAALPSTGLSFTVPRLTAAPTVADTNEGAAPSETGMTSDYITIDVNKFAGLNRVSFELLERSQPNFGDLLLRELQKAYAKATDTAVIAQLTAGGTAATATAGTLAGLQSFIATESPAAYLATGGDIADNLLASSAWWSALLNANDSSNRPLFTALQPSNAAGTANIGEPNGAVFGTNFYIDHNIATAGLIDESAFLIARDSVGLWESPTTQLRVNVLTSGEVELSLHGYLAVKVLKAGGVRRFNLT
jgi:HK97 family phage major capsid protein